MRNFVFILLFLPISIFAQSGGVLVWQEDFDGEELDMNVWNFELGNGCPNICGWGNNERQFYTKKNHELKDGYLIITAKKEDSIYTSTRITTQGKKEFKYGRMEARAKVPVGHGIWPAFWMLGSNIGEVGWPRSGEIDILEYVGRQTDTVYTTLHLPVGYGENALSKQTHMPDIEEGFHTYAVDWSPEEIVFLVDNKKVYSYSVDEKTKENWPFDQPFYFILNVAVGGNFGGPDVDDSIFPQQYIVDYVRVFKTN